MANDEDIISQVLDLSPIEKDNAPLPTTYRPSLDVDDAKQIETDTTYVRQNLYDLIEKGHSAIDELLAIADQSQHPRSYEVLATMIKTMVDTNKDLMDMHEKKKKLKGEIQSPSEKTVNNNLFVGSTSDLLKIINKEND